jgi:hypothetical protein
MMDTQSLVFKLKDALNAHDIASFSDCFHENYYSEQPAHPERTFHGREIAVNNWAANFRELPDFTADLLDYAFSENAFWAEWDWKGTRADHSRLHLRGITIFGVDEGRIRWGKLYVEPVEQNGKGIEATVKEVMHGKKTDQ